MSGHSEMQPSGYTLHAPIEPEPRNVVATTATESATGNGLSSTYISAAAHSTTGSTTDALEKSANPANIERNERSSETASAEQAAHNESGWLWADRAQVLRAYQRDGLHVLKLQDLVSDVIRAVIGSRNLLANPSAVAILVKTLYYGLTFGLGTQTLGEEYVEIYPYTNGRRNFPSRFRRIASLVVLIGAPQVFSHLVESLAGHSTTPTDEGRPTRRQVLLRWLKSTWAKALPELWFAWFLIKGRNMEWTKSLMGMSYITNSPTSSQKAPSAYEPIGFLLVLPLITRLISSWKARREREEQEARRLREANPSGLQRHMEPRSDSRLFTIDGKSVDMTPKAEEVLTANTEEDESAYGNYSILSKSELANPDRQCPLCLAPCGMHDDSGGTCVTECGHVFCWSCIEEWAAEKMECPLCRQALRLERLTPLYNL